MAVVAGPCAGKICVTSTSSSSSSQGGRHSSLAGANPRFCTVVNAVAPFRGVRIRGARGFSSGRNGGGAPPVFASQEGSASTLLVQDVEFIWKGQGSEVLLTGNFLKWETKLVVEKRSNDVFSLKQKLPVGKYSYKFIVDGEWKHSPDSPAVPDGTGGFNNEVIVTDVPSKVATKDSPSAAKVQFPQSTNSTEKPRATTQPSKAVDSPKAKTQPAASPKQVSKASPKVVAKSLQETMLEDVISLLTTTLGKEDGLSDLDITFEDNQLKMSFAKGDIPYCFWAFFPDGTLEGSRGFSLTSHGSPPSTVEPFLIDEKKITPELLVFWVRKRLFAQNLLSLN